MQIRRRRTYHVQWDHVYGRKKGTWGAVLAHWRKFCTILTPASSPWTDMTYKGSATPYVPSSVYLTLHHWQYICKWKQSNTRDVQFWHISTNATAVLFLGCFYLQGLNYTTETFSPEINLCSLDSLGPAPFACLFHGATLGHQVQEWHKIVAFGGSCVCTISALLCTCVYNMPFDVMSHSTYLLKFQTQLQSNVLLRTTPSMQYSTWVVSNAAVVVSDCHIPSSTDLTSIT